MIRATASALSSAAFLLAVSSPAHALQAAEPGTVLTPGATVERHLEGSERHKYDIQLQADEFAALTVEQRGVDVIVYVVDGAGATVALFDDEARPGASEHVGIVAPAPGPMHLVIAAKYPKYGTGQYVVRVDEIRAATDRARALYEARTLAQQAAAFHNAGKFAEAVERAARALTRADSAAGSNEGYVGELARELANYQRAAGDDQAALQSFQRALTITEATLGPNHPQAAQVMDSLGALYNARGDYARAESLFTDAVAIDERALGEHPLLAAHLVDLSLLHKNRGDSARALEELERAYRIADRMLQPDDFALIAIINNLGDLYVSLREYDRAQPLVERALHDIERVYGRDNFRVTYPLLNLGIIARERKDYTHALEYLQRGYTIRERTYGPDNTTTISVLISLGDVERSEGQYQKALETFQHVLATLERTGSPYQTLSLSALEHLVDTSAAAGDFQAAVRYQARLDSLGDDNITFNLAIGSEREKLLFLDRTVDRMGRAISLHLRGAPGNQAAADLAASAILRRKGRVLDTLLDSRRALRSRLDPADRTMLDELMTVTEQLSRLALNGPGRKPIAEYQKSITDLETRRESVERSISSRSAPFRADVQQPSVAVVRAALPAHAALIEFAVYQPVDPKAPTEGAKYGDPRYAAYVLRPDAETEGVDLGPASAINEAVARLREALRDPSRRDVTTLAGSLDRLVLRPLRPLAGSATQLLLAPDGPLTLIPFEALVDERGRFEVQRYAISYLDSGRDVVRLQVPRAAAGAPLVVADPDFGEPSAAREPSSSAKASSGRRPAAAYFTPLPGAELEAAAIARLLPGATVLSGNRATREALMQVVAPSVLHIASHAFFQPEDEAEPHPAAAGTRSMTPTIRAENPLLRSGIALAGANLPGRGGESGILTALEASTLNLWGTELVTLSACDTGVGDVRNGEGVFGLRRAFFVAGTETLVMSLWPVSDFVTRSVMTRYYTGLAHGEGRGEALRRSQLAMLKDPELRHPFYWSGFIQAGDWTPLKRLR